MLLTNSCVRQCALRRDAARDARRRKVCAMRFFSTSAITFGYWVSLNLS
jgi:hypothetical protein